MPHDLPWYDVIGATFPRRIACGNLTVVVDVHGFGCQTVKDNEGAKG